VFVSTKQLVGTFSLIVSPSFCPGVDRPRPEENKKEWGQPIVLSIYLLFRTHLPIPQLFLGPLYPL